MQGARPRARALLQAPCPPAIGGEVDGLPTRWQPRRPAARCKPARAGAVRSRWDEAERTRESWQPVRVSPRGPLSRLFGSRGTAFSAASPLLADAAQFAAQSVTTGNVADDCALANARWGLDRPEAVCSQASSRSGGTSAIVCCEMVLERRGLNEAMPRQDVRPRCSAACRHECGRRFIPRPARPGSLTGCRRQRR